MDGDKEYQEVIDKLSKENDIENILKFNETDIQEKLMQNSTLIWHFTELYQREKNDLDKIIELKDKLVGERYDFYKNKTDLNLRQGEIEKYYLPKEPKILKLNDIIRKQKWRVEFYDGVRKAVEKMQWNMKVFLDSYKTGL